MIVQLCSTLVLFLLMKKFLWPSVKRYLDKRADKMQADIAAGEQARREAQDDRAKAADELAKAAGRGEQIVSAAVKEAQDQKAEILQQAKQEADAEKARAHEQIESERADMYQDMQKEMVDVAMSAAAKLIGTQNQADLDRAAVDAFVKEAAADGK
jgi:F-type H+-transporting ATPase subunit b